MGEALSEYLSPGELHSSVKLTENHYRTKPTKLKAVR